MHVQDMQDRALMNKASLHRRQGWGMEGAHWLSDAPLSSWARFKPAMCCCSATQTQRLEDTLLGIKTVRASQTIGSKHSAVEKSTLIKT